MKTHLEFTSTAFPAYPGEDKDINPGIFGKRLAEFLAEGLRKKGLQAILRDGLPLMLYLRLSSYPIWHSAIELRAAKVIPPDSALIQQLAQKKLRSISGS